MRLNSKQGTISEGQRKKERKKDFRRHSPMPQSYRTAPWTMPKKSPHYGTNRLGLISILCLITPNMDTIGGRQFSSVWIQLSATRISVMYDYKE
jgi:hypothetical protein